LSIPGNHWLCEARRVVCPDVLYTFNDGFNMIEIQLPDGTVVSHPDDATPLSVADAIGSRLAKAVIAAQVGTVVIDVLLSFNLAAILY